jgi:hypothetical protein
VRLERVRRTDLAFVRISVCTCVYLESACGCLAGLLAVDVRPTIAPHSATVLQAPCRPVLGIMHASFIT